MDHANPDMPAMKLRRWIIESASRTDDGALQPDTNLLEEGYIDSLGLIGLILFVEQLRGAPIVGEQLSAQNFLSLRRIEQTFLAGSAGHA